MAMVERTLEDQSIDAMNSAQKIVNDLGKAIVDFGKGMTDVPSDSAAVLAAASSAQVGVLCEIGVAIAIALNNVADAIRGIGTEEE